ncbi:uncharacterized protein [Euwallacea fornicatus]|uniref:uncharacterized protein n=1 Tax=Euwallacea fornicatus TaxID=995702 RepID=UPI00338D448E
MSDDLLQGTGDAVADAVPEAELAPKEDLDKLMEMLGKLPAFAGVDKETLLKNLGQGKARPPIGDVVANPWVEFLVLFTMISLVILLLAFIGYKLYTNMASKEKRRELKKAQKDQKKKK